MRVQFILCMFALMATTTSAANLQEIFKNANDQFTANMLQNVVNNNKDRNCVLSAFSVLTPLALLSLASVGETHDEILKGIGLSNDNETIQVFADMTRRLTSVKGVELKHANKIYIRNGLTLKKSFLTKAQKVFNSEIENINFSQADEAAKEINAWVEYHTNKRIQDVVDPQSVEYATAMLINAIYFKGNWTASFSKSDTQDQNFYVSKQKTISVPMMYQSNYFNYKVSKELDAKILKMDYEGYETSLVVVLPNKIDGINDLIKSLKKFTALNKVLNHMVKQKVEVTIPKFRIETTTDLRHFLDGINIKRVFNGAQLDKLLEQSTTVDISSAIQKAFIEVNEEGTEAAAANSFAMLMPGFEELSETFRADHPFLYFLMLNNQILFTGVLRSP